MSRTDNIKKNLIFNAIKFVTQLVLQFLLRTVLIYTMGVEYLGLNGLFTNIFAFLNLAELGIGSAIVFSMYKPIADGDTEKIKSLQALYKRFYGVITIIVLVLGIILTPFIEFFISGGIEANINIYVLYLMYLVNTLVGYLCAHKRSLLFAYQRNDIESKIRTLCLVGMTILQIVVLLLTKDYYLYFAMQILFTIVECVWIYVVANKKYPEINGKAEPLDKDTRKEITKNVAALSMHKIGASVVFSTDNILISSFLGVVILGAYSNYYLITSALVSVFTVLRNALAASIGNLVASTDSEYAYKKFKIINFIFSFLSAFTSICLVVLFQPFIEKWTGGGEYLLEFSTVIIIVISYYLSRMRTAVLLYKDAAGLFWKDRWKPILETVVNLVSSIVLVQFMGINGIFIGTILSTIAGPLWIEPMVVYRNYFKKPLRNYFYKYLLDAGIMLVVGAITFMLCALLPTGGIGLLILKFIVCMAITGILLLLAYIPTKEFKECFAMGITMLKKILNRKVKEEDKKEEPVATTIVDNNETK